MAERNYDPAFADLIALLPTVTDFSTPEKIVELRAATFDFAGPAPEDRDDVTKEDRTVPGPAVPAASPDVPIRIYRPNASQTSERRGCLVEIHGGGFLTGSIEQMDAWCQFVSAAHGAIVVSVEYRLAPESPFPAGIEDCYAALCWTSENADALGVDPDRIAIGGQSAGGGLAAGTALMARDRGGPKLCFQLLEIPELDDRLATPSMMQFVDTPLWNRPNAVWSWKHYLGADHEGEVSAYAAPARATDLSGLPPAYVTTMEFDPLRDEGIQYALRMMQSGVSVELHAYPGTFHGSALLPTAEVSRRGAEEVQTALGVAIGPKR